MSQKPMGGRICLVTGGTSGMGAATAEALAARGATVVIVGRSAEKGAKCLRAIRERTGNDRLEYILADLSSQAEVRRTAAEFRAAHDHLHVLVNNVGATFAKRRQSVDGLEMTWALDHLAPFLLTNLLLDLLVASAPARIVTVSSGLHQGKTIAWDDLQSKHGYSWGKAYGQAKLANIMFTYELARRLAGTGVRATAANPGLVASNFGLENGGMHALAKRFANLFAVDAPRGAETVIALASGELADETERYWEKCHPVSSSPASYDQVAQARLWQVSAEETGLA